MNLLLALAFAFAVIGAGAIGYAIAVKRIAGTQPGEELIDRVLARAAALGLLKPPPDPVEPADPIPPPDPTSQPSGSTPQP